MENSGVFRFNRVTLGDSRVLGLNRVTGGGRRVCCVSIPVKLAARLHRLARIPASSRIAADLGAIVPFSPVAMHRLHFATHALAAERLTDKQKEESNHAYINAPARPGIRKRGGGAHVNCWP